MPPTLPIREDETEHYSNSSLDVFLVDPDARFDGIDNQSYGMDTNER